MPHTIPFILAVVQENCVRQELWIKLIPQPQQIYSCRHNNEGNLDGSYRQQV